MELTRGSESCKDKCTGQMKPNNILQGGDGYLPIPHLRIIVTRQFIHQCDIWVVFSSYTMAREYDQERDITLMPL